MTDSSRMENRLISDIVSENTNMCSGPSNLKITDIRVANIDGFTLRYFLRFYWKSNAGSAFFDRARWFDLLMGTDTVRKEILAGKSETEIRAGWKAELQKYKEMREKYLLY